MNTDINFTNSFSNMQLSQTQKENPENYEWMGQTQNEMGLNFGQEEKLENAYDKLTQQKETVSTDIQQTILETDNYKDIFDMLGYWSPYSAIQTLSKNLSFSKKSSDLPNNVVKPASHNDNAYSGPRALRDGGPANDSGLQFREDKLISGTGKNQYGLTSGGGTTGGGKRVKEDISQRIPFLQTEIKKKFGSAAKGVSQKVISDFATESICSIIDSSREKGLQNTEISKILTKTLCTSIHTLKGECLKKGTRLFIECLPMVVPQLECFTGPLQTVVFLFQIHSVIRDVLAGRWTFWRLIEWLFSKAVSLGILYFIACMFGPIGCVATTAVTIAINVTKRLFKRVLL